MPPPGMLNLCRLVFALHLQQIPPEYHLQVLVPGEILGKTDGRMLLQPQAAAPGQHLGHELGAEVVILLPEGQPQYQPDDHTQTAVAQVGAVIMKDLKQFLYGKIRVFRDFQVLQGAGEGVAAGLVGAADALYDEAFPDEAVEGV